MKGKYRLQFYFPIWYSFLQLTDLSDKFIKKLWFLTESIIGTGCILDSVELSETPYFIYV